MVKKILLAILTLTVVLGTFAWFNRIELMLAMVKHSANQEFQVKPNRPIPWSQGQNLPDTSPSQKPPNIVFILLDDLGMNDISSFGGGVANGRVKTPNIDRLATDGAIFKQAYAGNATCAPSRAMILTGRYPTRTGFEFTPVPPGMGASINMISSSLDNGLPPVELNETATERALPYEEQGLPNSEITIAEILKDKGYKTAHIGKWHLGRAKGYAPNDQGFDESLLMSSGLYLPENHPDVVNAKTDFDPIDQFLWARMKYAASFNHAGNEDVFEPDGYITDYYTDESINFIDANKNNPFFLYLAHWGVHTPLQASKADYDAVGDIKPHRHRVYAAMVRALDRSVGRIVAALDEKGLSDNTIIVLTSDNGGAGYIGLPDVNQPYRGWKLTMFEGGIKVPTFIKWPSKIKPGTIVNTPVAHIDMMPTLAKAAGAPLPPGLEIDGVDILPFTIDSLDNSARTLFWQSGQYQAVRHEDWKLQVNKDKVWLFDLGTDPTEQKDLAESQPEKLKELRKILDDHVSSGRGVLYPSVANLPVSVDKTLDVPYKDGEELVWWSN